MLTQRELEVLECICKGYSNSEIAKELFISEHTAKAHVTSILRKFNVKNRTLAAYFAGKNDFPNIQIHKD